MVELLTPDDIRARVAERTEAVRAVEAEVFRQKYRYVRPFVMAADGLIEVVQNAEGRFMFGLKELDLMTRGIGRGELAYVIGRAHSGKTQLVLNAVRHNPHKRILWFTPDEVSEIVLSKLVSMTNGISSEEIERLIREGDERTIRMVRKAAEQDHANLIVIDESLTFTQMTEALKEAEDYWGAKCDLVVQDTLELIVGDGTDGVIEKSHQLKRWGKDADVPVVVLHHTGKSNAPQGKASGLDGMRYGGDTDAMFVIEVYRKGDDVTQDGWERVRHENTVTVSVCKNKRPPCKKGEHDYWMEPTTGLIRQIAEADWVASGAPTQSPSVLAQARAMKQGEAF